MNIKNTVVAVFSLAGAIMLAGCASIQAVVDGEIACGNGPKAEEAAARLTDEAALTKVITTGMNDKARAAAIKKSNDVQTLARLTCSADESSDIRMTSFQRLIELGVVDSFISGDPNFAAVILTGGGSSSGAGRRRGGAGQGMSSSGQAMQFPVEYRLKAVAPIVNAGWPANENLKSVALDDSAPIEVRTAAIQNMGCLDSRDFKELMKRAGDSGNSRREANEQLVTAYIGGGDLENRGVSEAICDLSLPLSSRQLAFSSIKIRNDEDITFIRFLVIEIISSEDNIFAKYVIANAPQEALAESMWVNANMWHDNPYLNKALDRIANDDLLVKIAQESSYGNVSLGAARRIKNLEDPAKKLIVDIAEAKNNPDAQGKAAAFCRVYAANPKEAYNIARNDDKLIISISDKKVVLGLLELSREKGKDWPQDDKVRKQLMKAVYAIYEKHVNGLSKENQEEHAAKARERAKSLAAGGKTCVIGNYYAGMPIDDFIVLNKVQDIKATAQHWRQVAQSEEFAVDAFALDTKNLYKATGLEKSELRFELPGKLGIAKFDVETTDVKYERNYLAEAFDVYDAGKITGGDLYFKSENQAKGVRVILWDKTGIVEISAL